MKSIGTCVWLRPVVDAGYEALGSNEVLFRKKLKLVVVLGRSKDLEGGGYIRIWKR